jgi:hypothetical protein
VFNLNKETHKDEAAIKVIITKRFAAVEAKDLDGRLRSFFGWTRAMYSPQSKRNLKF